MRGAISQWDIGSQWLGDGGVYPGMGDSIGLAGTSPERVRNGLYNDGGTVGDPPYDPYDMESFDASIGASAGAGGSGGYYPAPSSSGGGEGFSGEEGEPNVLVGLGVAGGATLLIMWAHHRFNVGDGKGFSSIKGTAGDLAIIGVGAWAITPAVKASVTFLADLTGWRWLQEAAVYGNAA